MMLVHDRKIFEQREESIGDRHVVAPCLGGEETIAETLGRPVRSMHVETMVEGEEPLVGGQREKPVPKIADRILEMTPVRDEPIEADLKTVPRRHETPARERCRVEPLGLEQGGQRWIPGAESPRPREVDELMCNGIEPGEERHVRGNRPAGRADGVGEQRATAGEGVELGGR